MVSTRDELILSHQGIARATALAFARSRRLPPDDLCQEAFVALVMAADSYDPNRGAQFITYAVWVIRGALSEVAYRERRHSHPLVFQAISKDALGRPRPTYARLAVVEMDEVPPDGRGAPRGDSVPSLAISQEDQFMRKELLEAARLALQSAAANRGVLAQVLAMNRASGSPKSTAQIADFLGVKLRTARGLDALVMKIARSMAIA